jgi:hypothetical protein
MCWRTIMEVTQVVVYSVGIMVLIGRLLFVMRAETQRQRTHERMMPRSEPLVRDLLN